MPSGFQRAGLLLLQPPAIRCSLLREAVRLNSVSRRGAFSPLSSPLPVWECEAMHTAAERPLYLHLDDLKDAWRETNGTELDESDLCVSAALDPSTSGSHSPCFPCRLSC